MNRQEHFITEIRRSVQKRDSIMLKYNWKREDREDFLSLPKINSRAAKKKQTSTQVERNIASLKYNISKTNQNLESLDKKIINKTNSFKSLNHNLNHCNKNLLNKENMIQIKKQELMLEHINKNLSLFKASIAQKKAKALGLFKEKTLKGSKNLYTSNYSNFFKKFKIK